MEDDLVAVVVLGHLDVPGYGTYRSGGVTGFESRMAEALIQRRLVRRLREAPPAPSTSPVPRQAPKPPVAEPTTPAPLAEPMPPLTAPSSQLQAAAALLREVLSRGPAPVAEVLTLARQRGISRATLWRGKRALCPEDRDEGGVGLGAPRRVAALGAVTITPGSVPSSEAITFGASRGRKLITFERRPGRVEARAELR